MAFNDNNAIWTAGQISTDALVANSITSGNILISGTFSGTTTIYPSPRCLAHLSGEWVEQPDEVFSSTCQLCGELMTVTLPDELAWVVSLKSLLTRVVLGDINDELRAVVKLRQEALDLATEQMALLQLLLQ